MTTAATGRLPHQGYGSLPGFAGRPMKMPMERAFVMCVGPPGQGKTTFIQSCSTGYVFNLDGSSTSPHIKSMVWPGINDKGQMCDSSGPIVLSWEKMLDVCKQILDRAKEGKPCPTTVFFDSLDAMIALVQDYLIRQNDVEFWQDLDGRRMYSIAYDRIVRLCHSFLNVGIGVWIIGHVINAKINIGEDRFAIRPELTIGDGLWKRLEWALEMVCGIEIAEHTEMVARQAPPKPDGSERKTKAPMKPITTTRHVFATDNSKYKELMKKRVSIPGEIPLPYEDGWSVVSSEYSAAAAIPHT